MHGNSRIRIFFYHCKLSPLKILHHSLKFTNQLIPHNALLTFILTNALLQLLLFPSKDTVSIQINISFVKERFETRYRISNPHGRPWPTLKRPLSL